MVIPPSTETWHPVPRNPPVVIWNVAPRAWQKLMVSCVSLPCYLWHWSLRLKSWKRLNTVSPCALLSTLMTLAVHPPCWHEPVLPLSPVPMPTEESWESSPSQCRTGRILSPAQQPLQRHTIAIKTVPVPVRDHCYQDRACVHGTPPPCPLAGDPPPDWVRPSLSVTSTPTAYLTCTQP